MSTSLHLKTLFTGSVIGFGFKVCIANIKKTRNTKNYFIKEAETYVSALKQLTDELFFCIPVFLVSITFHLQLTNTYIYRC
jgi:hypothetical protein